LPVAIVPLVAIAVWGWSTDEIIIESGKPVNDGQIRGGITGRFDGLRKSPVMIRSMSASGGITISQSFHWDDNSPPYDDTLFRNSKFGAGSRLLVEASDWTNPNPNKPKARFWVDAPQMSDIPNPNDRPPQSKCAETTNTYGITAYKSAIGVAKVYVQAPPLCEEYPAESSVMGQVLNYLQGKEFQLGPVSVESNKGASCPCPS
jgi:hypothetical protein